MSGLRRRGTGASHGIRRPRGTPPGTHIPVMVRQVLEALRPDSADVVVDCTIGYGGHACRFLRVMRPDAVLIGLDVDGRYLDKVSARLGRFGRRVRLWRRNFADLAEVLAAEGIGGANVIFADLGVSSMQVDDPNRGFSYKHSEAPLDMRMDDRLEVTAADLLASLPQDQLDRALLELADEPDHQQIAQFIAAQRMVRPITSTGELIRLVFAAKGTTEKAWSKGKTYQDPHPAALTFQALRILVNRELENLQRLLEVAPGLLAPGGRIGIISFQKGEDRLVRASFREGLRKGTYSAISKHTIVPSSQEVRANPRSSSGRFRWAVRPCPT